MSSLSKKQLGILAATSLVVLVRLMTVWMLLPQSDSVSHPPPKPPEIRQAASQRDDLVNARVQAAELPPDKDAFWIRDEQGGPIAGATVYRASRGAAITARSLSRSLLETVAISDVAGRTLLDWADPRNATLIIWAPSYLIATTGRVQEVRLQKLLRLDCLCQAVDGSP